MNNIFILEYRNYKYGLFLTKKKERNKLFMHFFQRESVYFAAEYIFFLNCKTLLQNWKIVLTIDIIFVKCV